MRLFRKSFVWVLCIWFLVVKRDEGLRGKREGQREREILRGVAVIFLCFCV